VSVVGVTANNKVYDGATTATLNVASAALVGVVSGDNVTLDTSAATGAFGDKSVGTGKTVTVSGLALSGTTAGNYTVIQPTGTASITPVTLTPAIAAASRTYDGTTAATITARTLAGALGSEDVSLVGGTASFADKNVGAGKAVTATGLSLSGADAGNYQLASTSATTTADITPAGTANLVTSSANPSAAGSSVTFTASLTAVAPGAGTPTGSVQFRTNGVAAGDPVTLVNGAASFSTALLSPGTNSITAEYAGDANFTGKTSTLNPPQVVTESIFGILVGVLKNHSVAVRTEKLLATDVAVTLASVSANSTNGGTVTLTNGLVTYTPTTNFIGADLFTYVVNDGSTFTTGSVHVVVADTGTLAPNRIGVVVVGPDGAHARFAGVPGFTYIIERSTDGADWTAVGSAVVPANGLFEFLDSNPPPGSVFYRTTVP
jgi:hypothetical protein